MPSFQLMRSHPHSFSRRPWQQTILLVFTALWLWCIAPQGMAFARETAPQNGSSIQPYIDRVADRVTKFTLDNGMRFVVLERHQAPVVSFMTYVDVGAAQEEEGKTGAAHFLEHLAFKGTTRIGTKDYSAEQPVLDRLDQLFDQLQAARASGQTEQIAQLQQEFDSVRAEAAQYVKQNEMGQIVEQAGGVGLNATTSADATRYFYSFPSNKLELWMSLESERFLEPVFREFYEEKDVILEERRMRTDNSPTGRIVEAFLETALADHPYGRPIIGYETDIRNLRRQDIRDFFNRYYTPHHIITVVVGDVNPRQVKRLAATYFGRYSPGTEVPVPPVPAPIQTAPRSVTLTLPAEPLYLEGYQRPGISSPDRNIYDIIAAILVGGRTSRLYQALVEQQQIALDVDVLNGFPGDRYDNLLAVYALTAPGHTVEEIAAALNVEIERLKTEPVSAAELERIKTQSRASVLQNLSSNQGMASLLASYEALTGDWRNLFEDLKAVDAATPADIQRVAQALFQPDKKTVGTLLPSKP
ncbi:MAG TPA: insulinase family protein [Chroococcidiopsis sp.]